MKMVKVFPVILGLMFFIILPAFSQRVYNFELMWGSYGAGNGQFNNPVGVAVDSSGNVYVADYGNHRIQKFNQNGNYITQWDSPGDSHFAESVAVDPSGNVYVVGNLTTIKKFDSNGNLIDTWKHSVNDLGSGQIATDLLGNVYATNHYVCFLSACPGPMTRYSIRKFDPTGNLMVEWGESGTGDGQFWYPRGVAALDRIIRTKKKGNERDRIDRSPELESFLQVQLKELETLLPENPPQLPIEEFDQVFRTIVKSANTDQALGQGPAINEKEPGG
jgi:hypothetical protein